MSWQPSVPSPCVRVCKLGEDGVCLGCGRILDEIAQWPLMHDAERERVVGLSRDRLRSRTQRENPAEPEIESTRP